MAIKFDIQVRNGTVTITVGREPANARNQGGAQVDAAKQGGQGPSQPPTDTGSGGPGSGCCCAPVVIGPIVIDGSSMQAQSGLGGQGPSQPPTDTGSGGVSRMQGVSGKATGGQGPSQPPTDSGSGGPGSGCCCAPVVIGPIVIGGCCSGQAASSVTALSGPTAVSVNPPAQVKLQQLKTTRVLAQFTMQQQQETDWCWAAVAAAVSNFLAPQTVPAWTQGAVATPVVEMEYQNSFPSGVDCSQTPGLCNYPAKLEDALEVTGNLSTGGTLFDKYLDFDSIQNWVNVQLPVCARIVWFLGGAHFIALDGWGVDSSGNPYVHVQDPNYGPCFWLYDDLVNSYQYQGNWNDTYLVKA